LALALKLKSLALRLKSLLTTLGYFFGNFREERRPALPAHKDQQESRAVAGKPSDDVVKFYTYRKLHGIARFSL